MPNMLEPKARVTVPLLLDTTACAGRFGFLSVCFVQSIRATWFQAGTSRLACLKHSAIPIGTRLSADLTLYCSQYPVT